MFAINVLLIDWNTNLINVYIFCRNSSTNMQPVNLEVKQQQQQQQQQQHILLISPLTRSSSYKIPDAHLSDS